MAQTFSVGSSTFREIDRLLAGINAAQGQFPKLWLKALNDAADIATKHIARNFSTQGTEFGNKWSSLAASTQADREKKGFKPTGPILVRRGRLRASLIDKKSAGHIRKITVNGIEMQSNVKTSGGNNLFLIHQGGTKNIPSRKMVREGTPPWISQNGWKEIQLRFVGTFIEIRRLMEKA